MTVACEGTAGDCFEAFTLGTGAGDRLEGATALRGLLALLDCLTGLDCLGRDYPDTEVKRDKRPVVYAEAGLTSGLGH